MAHAPKSTFDPYHKWLGIPQKYRPPTYYQLLGIDADETDDEVIEEAAIRQTAHLRTYQSGPHAKLCARLLNEIAQARTTLLNPAKRKQYDAALARKKAVQAAPPATGIVANVPESSPFADLDRTPAIASVPSARPYTKKSNTGLIIGLVVGIAAFLLVIGISVTVAAVLILNRPTSKVVDNDEPRPRPRPHPKPKPPVHPNPEPNPNPDPNPKPPVNPPVVAKVGRSSEVYSLAVEQATSVVDFRYLQGQRELLLAGRRVEKYHTDSQKRLLLYTGHAGILSSRTFLQLSEDNSTLYAVQMADRIVRVFEVATGKELGQIEGHTSGIHGMALLPDGKRLVTLGLQTLRIWDVATRKEVFRSPQTSVYSALAISPDGRKAWASVRGKQHYLEIWDLDKQQVATKMSLPAGTVNGIAVRDDGSFALALTEGTEQVRFGVLFGKLGQREMKLALTNRTLFSVDFSPDGKYVVASGDEPTFSLWDAHSHRRLHEFASHKKAVLRVRFSPDGQQIFSGGKDGCFKIWALPKNMEVVVGPKLPPGPRVKPKPQPPSPLKTPVLRLVSGTMGRTDVRLELEVVNWADYDDELFKPGTDEPRGRPRVMALLRGAEKRTLRRVTIQTAKDLQKFTVTIPKDRIDFKAVTLYMMDAATRRIHRSNAVDLPPFKATPQPPVTGKIEPLPLTNILRHRADTPYLIRVLKNHPIAVVGGRQLQLLHLQSGKLFRVSAPPNRVGRYVYAMAYSPDRGLIAASVLDTNAIVLCKVIQQGKQVVGAAPVAKLVGHTQRATRLAFFDGGKKLISISDDRSVRVWDVKTQKELQQLTGHSREALGLAITADGQRAATSTPDGEVRLWDLDKFSLIKAARIERILPRALSFTPDGKQLLLAGDGLVLLDTSDLSVVQRAPTFGRTAVHAQISPNGKVAVICNGDKQAQVWGVKDLQLYYQLKYTSPIRDAVFTANSHTIAAANFGSVLLWRLPSTDGPPEVTKKLVFQRQGTLTTQMKEQTYPIYMQAGQIYTIDQLGKFDTYLRLLDSQGKRVASNDDGGEGLNARLTFTAPRTGNYHIVATSNGGRDTGDYILRVHEMSMKKKTK